MVTPMASPPSLSRPRPLPTPRAVAPDGEPRPDVASSGVIVLALFGALFARLWYLQVAATGDFAAAAQSNSVRVINEPPIRGRILDAKGRPLVENRIANVITDRPQARREEARHGRQPARRAARDEGVGHPQEARRPPRLAVHAGAGRVRRRLRQARVRQRASRGLPRGEGGADGHPPATRTVGSPRTSSATSARSTRTSSPRSRSRRTTSSATRSARTASSSPTSPTSAARPARRGSRSTRPGACCARCRARHRSRATTCSSRSTSTCSAWPRTRWRRASTQRKNLQDKSDKNRFVKFNAPAGAVGRARRDDGLGRGDGVVSRATTRTSSSNGIPTPKWQELNDPANDYPLVDRAISGQYAPGSTFKLISAIAGQQAGLITANKTIDDKGKYAVPDRPGALLHATTTTRGTAGSTWPGRSTVSSDVYFYTIGGDLYYRQKHNLPGGDGTAGHRPPVRVRQDDRGRRCRTRRAVGCPTRRGSRRSTTRTRRRSRTPTGCRATTSISAVGQGDMLATPLQLANAYAAFANGGTLREPRLASEVHRRQRQEGARPRADHDRDRSPVPGRDAMLAGFTGVAEDDEGHGVQRLPRLPAGARRGQDRHRAGAGQADRRRGSSG